MVFQHRRHARGNSLFSRATSDLHARDDCEPADPLNTLTDRLNTLLNSSGPGYTLPLCPSVQYYIQAPIVFAAPDQEISTAGYPTGDDRATLVVNGPVALGSGHTTAIDGTCQTCSGVKLRNIQINGTRQGASPTNGGANIEMGGGNSDQLIEYVHSFDPRSWSCLHIAEGPLTCNNATVQHNDIGPCGSDTFQEWADGISVSCRNSLVRNNTISNPTDGGIVLFGSPGTLVENNTIFVETNTLLGGINLVDYLPFDGDYTGTIVRDNIIMGGFATDEAEPGDTKGNNNEDVIIKIGIAIGPRTWFGDRYGARNFTVENNALFGNTSFIGSRGPNCSNTDITPSPAPFVIDLNLTTASTTQLDFQSIPDGDGLTCILPPDGGDFWPFGGNPEPGQGGGGGGGGEAQSNNGGGGLSGGAKAGIAIGVILGVAGIAVAAWFVRKWALKRSAAVKADQPWNRDGYIQNNENIRQV
ncbi:unnamed protein product [Somion occarium]|uniref:Right handed beta helix domain-containing protein n=1 Tax=Somion occarium TaxID=3059160 RepID=A0ABP1CXA0_9APHY